MQHRAPEVLGGSAKVVGGAADVWALGALLFHLLTGEVPYQGCGTLQQLLVALCVEGTMPLLPADPQVWSFWEVQIWEGPSSAQVSWVPSMCSAEWLTFCRC